MPGKHPPRTPPFPPTLEACITQLAAIQRQRPGQLASWLRAQRPHPEERARAVFVSVVDLQPEPPQDLGNWFGGVISDNPQEG